MALGKRILKSAGFQNFVVWCMAQYIRFCWVTTRWEEDGLDDLKQHLKTEGPVIIVLWHEHIALAPKAWPIELSPVCSLTQDAHAGRIAGRILERFGFENRSLAAGTSELKILREVLNLARDGVSIGIAADGPEGPVRKAKSVPVVWSRTTALPIWIFGYSTTMFRRLDTWDRMILPLPAAKGRLVFRKFSDPISRSADKATLEKYQQDLEAALNSIMKD